jgi:FeS assembly SUF system protein
MATITREQVVETLQNVFDPEIPVDIYNLGLVYEVDVAADDSVEIVMSLTSESCPSAKAIPDDVKKKVERIPGVKSCSVRVVWEPKWTAERISPKGREVLGLDES